MAELLRPNTPPAFLIPNTRPKHGLLRKSERRRPIITSLILSTNAASSRGWLPCQLPSTQMAISILHSPANTIPSLPTKLPGSKPICKSRSPQPKIPRFNLSFQSPSTKTHLLNLISDQDRGLKTQTNLKTRSQIIEAIESLAVHGKDTVTTDSSLSGTWRMLWTTEKEQLFIIRNANWFGTKVGDVLQVIDVDNLALNNVITFPPSGVFFVRSQIEIASIQRVNFRFTSAVLRGKDWEFPLPPFGQGWFESVYMDDDIRVAKDIRGDYLVVDRAPYEWKE